MSGARLLLVTHAVLATRAYLHPPTPACHRTQIICKALHITNRPICSSSYSKMEGLQSEKELKEKNGETETESQNHLYKDIEDEGWALSSQAFLALPLDPQHQNYIRRNVPNAVFSRVAPVPLEGQTFLAGASKSALDLLDLHPSATNSTKFKEFACGGWVHPGTTPLAHRYGGHQFGWWAEQLGDGRAHLLGHYTNRGGAWWEVQLKGSGVTPYSRAGDGRAVVRSSVREFLAAEAMHALGFRTSRSVSVVVGDEVVARDKFYNGNVTLEKTAVVMRLAPSWFRFGSLEILSKRQEMDALKQLVEHILDRHFPAIPRDHPQRYLTLFEHIVADTAEMIAQWQSVGFTHGVMNTDNMSILSVAIDYGPFGFMEAYDPNFVPNSSDDEGMYSYKNQPKVGFSNLRRLAEALLPLVDKEHLTLVRDILLGYNKIFHTTYLKLFTRKLGLQTVEDEDEVLVKALLDMMENTKADFTATFWEFGNVTVDQIKSGSFPENFWGLPRVAAHEHFNTFLDQYEARLAKEGTADDARQTTMTLANPRYVLRNWIAQEVIDKVESGQYDVLARVLEVLQTPFTAHHWADHRGFAQRPPKWSRKLKVSCSS